VALSSIVAGQVVSRTGRFRPVLFAAPVILGAGLLLLAWPMTSVDLRFVGALVVAGIGAGIASSMFPVVVQNAVPADTLGVATGASHFSRVLSGAVLLPVLGTLVASRLHAERMHGFSAHNAVTHATPIVFIVLLPLVVATFAAVFRTERGELRGVPVIAGAGSEVAT
jgi:hypothetical protein